jgi:hypothetical protein
MSKIQLYIEVDDTNVYVCGILCPFLNDDECDLFNTTLEDVKLPENHVWQDGVVALKVRCSRCINGF